MHNVADVTHTTIARVHSKRMIVSLCCVQLSKAYPAGGARSLELRHHSDTHSEELHHLSERNLRQLSIMLLRDMLDHHDDDNDSASGACSGLAILILIPAFIERIKLYKRVDNDVYVGNFLLSKTFQKYMHLYFASCMLPAFCLV